MTQSTANIRKATQHDIPAVLALYRQPEIDNGMSLSVEEAEKIFSRFEQYPNYCLYVAEVDNRVVGSFALLIMDNLGHMGAPSAIVEDVVVAPELHRQGIGRKMMEFAIVLAEKHCCYKIMISANCKRDKAHQFYESLGFDKHGYSFRIELC